MRAPVAGRCAWSAWCNGCRRTRPGAGSRTVRDHSGRGFHAKAVSGRGGFLPTFTGDRMRLNSDYQQYLVINRTFGQTFKTLDSFSATASINVVSLDAISRLFEWGVLGK